MKSKTIENINQAFLQLEYSIKLLTYSETNQINKDEFDTHVIWPSKIINLNFFHNSFKTYDDLILAAENSYSITLGFTSIVLDEALQSIGIKCDPSDLTPNGMLRTLVYMIRCAYAHNMMYPKWEVQGGYARPLSIILQHETLELDLSQKNGHLFLIDDIGGVSNYLEIKDKICQLISEA